MASLMVAAGHLGAATYYVDFESGSDTANGQSPAATWKHCPGDSNAVGVAGSTSLQPGDTVVFKGGVKYFGSIVCNWSGATDSPITYDGNTAGAFGTGRAIIDGSEPLAGWTQCTSAAEAGGNPNWANIYYTYAPADSNPFTANLYEANTMLWITTDPNLSDPFYLDKAADYMPIVPGNATSTTLVDDAYFTQSDPDAWDGAYVAIWAQPNFVYFQAVTGFEPAAHRISYEELSAPHYPDTGRYAMMNHLRILDTPGEFVYSLETDATGRPKVFLWPFAAGPSWDQEVTISRRNTALNINGRTHITVQGLLIQKFISTPPHRGAGVSNNLDTARSIEVRDNVVRYCNMDSTWKHAAINFEGVIDGTIENNQIYENRRIGGVYLLGGSENILVKGNAIRKCGYQGIWLIGAPNCQIISNTVDDNLGTHSNGITVYHGSNGVLVFGNRVMNSNFAFASEVVSDVTIAYNIFLGDSIYVAINWYDSTDLRYYNNIILGPQAKALMLSRSGTTNCVVKNNVLAGLLINAPFDVSHNLYVDHYQGLENLDPALLVDAIIETDLTKIFVDPANHDYRLKVDSPAIDSGTDVGLTKDYDGNPVPVNGVPDMGAYEFAADSITGWNVVAQHGAAEIVGAVTENYIEPRTQGLHKLRIDFAAALDPATVSTSVISITGDASGDQSAIINTVTLVGGTMLEVTLSSPLPDSDRFTIAVSPALEHQGGEPVSGDLNVRLATLTGDVNASESVTAADFLVVRDVGGEAVTASNAACDVNGSGGITGVDMLVIRGFFGHTLP